MEATHIGKYMEATYTDTYMEATHICILYIPMSNVHIHITRSIIPLQVYSKEKQLRYSTYEAYTGPRNERSAMVQNVLYPLRLNSYTKSRMNRTLQSLSLF